MYMSLHTKEDQNAKYEISLTERSLLSTTDDLRDYPVTIHETINGIEVIRYMSRRELDHRTQLNLAVLRDLDRMEIEKL